MKNKKIQNLRSRLEKIGIKNDAVGMKPNERIRREIADKKPVAAATEGGRGLGLRDRATEPVDKASGGLGLGGVRRKPTTDVAKIASNIIKKDGPLMQQARTDGLQYAASRGLLNSSIAAGAAQESVLSRAGEMASQIAQTRLTKQENRQDRKLERWRVETDRKLRIELANMEIDASDREKAAALFDENNKSYQQSVQSIMSNPDLSSSQRNELLRAAGDKLEIDNAVIKGLYGVKFNWKGKSFDPVGGRTNKDGEPVGRNRDEFGGDSKSNDSAEREEPKYIRVRGDGGWQTVPNPNYKG